MNNKSKQQAIPPEHDLILADQSMLRETGLVAIWADVMFDYGVARRKSVEALQEFLDERMEQNRIEAENAPPIEPISSEPIPSPEAASPPLELTEMMVFMQKIAQDGVLLLLNRNKQLMARGWISVVEKWKPKIMTNRGAIRQILLEISSIHGDPDPLDLNKLADKTNFFRTTDRLRDLQHNHGDDEAICLYDKEEKANIGYVTFPTEPDKK